MIDYQNEIDSQLTQNSFQDNNNNQKSKPIQKKKSKPYSNTKVKARNFLTNIAYRQYKDGDFRKIILLWMYFHFSSKI